MSSERLSLIYLDDEEINLILFKEMFKRDFDIYTTTSPHEAIDYVSKNEVDFCADRSAYACHDGC